MNAEYYARKLAQIFPDYEGVYAEHMEDFGELLGHVFFGSVFNSQLSKLLLANSNKEEIQKYIDFIEDMYANGDAGAQDIVCVTILAYLGDDDTILKHAFSYFSEDIIQASKILESGYGRREIRIYYKNGKVYTDW